jgi:hypothetical protein
MSLVFRFNINASFRLKSTAKTYIIKRVTAKNTTTTTATAAMGSKCDTNNNISRRLKQKKNH